MLDILNTAKNIQAFEQATLKNMKVWELKLMCIAHSFGFSLLQSGTTRQTFIRNQFFDYSIFSSLIVVIVCFLHIFDRKTVLINSFCGILQRKDMTVLNRVRNTRPTDKRRQRPISRKAIWVPVIVECMLCANSGGECQREPIGNEWEEKSMAKCDKESAHIVRNVGPAAESESSRCSQKSETTCHHPQSTTKHSFDMH